MILPFLSHELEAIPALVAVPAGPTASFDWAPEILTVDFTDTSTTDGDPIVSWAWDFGDGSTSTLQNPTHTYPGGGAYDVTLTVTDADGRSASATEQITVSAVGLAFGDGVYLAPTLVANIGTALYREKELLKSAGWTVVRSSDGVSFGTSDLWTSGTPAGVNRAWVQLQSPDGVRQIVIQKGTTTTGARVKYSKASKFTGGSPSATVTPSATDEVIGLGAGTDASPTFGVMFSSFGSGGGVILYGGADQEAPYDFYFSGLVDATTWDAAHGLALLSVAATHATDPDPYVLYVDGTSSAWEIGGIDTGSHVSGWLANGTSSTALRISDSAPFTFSPGVVDVGDNRTQAFVPFVVVPDVTIKGWTRNLAYHTRPRGTGSVRTTTYHLAGVANSLIRAGDVLLPWNQTLPAAVGTATWAAATTDTRLLANIE